VNIEQSPAIALSAALMAPLPLDILRPACRLFLDIAYPDGPETIPEARLPFHRIPADADVRDYLPPAPLAHGNVTILTGVYDGYSIRLGSASFPFLRLTLQQMSNRTGSVWLCGVDTHDAWHHPDHPDAAAWLSLQAANRELKARIESAWDAAGLLTHNRLLRQELQTT
jgi:hypothetical protein